MKGNASTQKTNQAHRLGCVLVIFIRGTMKWQKKIDPKFYQNLYALQPVFSRNYTDPKSVQ